jgi:hypothetical protein
MPTEISGSTGVNKITDGTVVDADINSSANITSYPRSVSDLFGSSDAQNQDFNLSTAGTYIFVSVTVTGSAQSEIGYVVSDGSSLTSLSHNSATGTIEWTNPSGTTLRIRDVNNDKELVVFGWRIK